MLADLALTPSLTFSSTLTITGLFSLPGQVRPQSQSFSGPSSFNANGTHENPPLFFRAPLGAVGPGAPIGSLARQSRRLYVGNITTEATEEAISAFFNGKMREMNLLSDGGLGEDLMGLGLKADEPVISVHLNYEKNYAFVEVGLTLSFLSLAFISLVVHAMLTIYLDCCPSLVPKSPRSYIRNRLRRYHLPEQRSQDSSTKRLRRR